MKNQVHTFKNILGILIIGLGAVLLLVNFDLLPALAERIIFSWQMLLIAIGVLQLIFGKHKISSAILITIGIVFLLPELPYFSINMRFMVWPILLILLGAIILLHRSQVHSKNTSNHCFSNRNKNNISEEDDVLEVVSIFGGSKRVINNQSLKGGKFLSVFGGAELDLSTAATELEKIEFDLVAVFGGVKIILPPEWHVKIEVVSIFGGVDHKKNNRSLNIETTEKTIIIKGIAVFGGAELISY